MTDARLLGRRPVTIVIAAVSLALEGLLGLGYAGVALGQVRMSRAGGWGWRCDTDGRLRPLASLGGTRGIHGQAVEQGTSGCCAADLAADRLELPWRRYHVDIGNPCSISDCRTGRRTAPALDRRLCSAACRQHAMSRRREPQPMIAIPGSPPEREPAPHRAPPQPRPPA